MTFFSIKWHDSVNTGTNKTVCTYLFLKAFSWKIRVPTKMLMIVSIFLRFCQNVKNINFSGYFRSKKKSLDSQTSSTQLITWITINIASFLTESTEKGLAKPFSAIFIVLCILFYIVCLFTNLFFAVFLPTQILIFSLYCYLHSWFVHSAAALQRCSERKDHLKINSKFKGEHPCRSAISIISSKATLLKSNCGMGASYS